LCVYLGMAMAYSRVKNGIYDRYFYIREVWVLEHTCRVMQQKDCTDKDGTAPSITWVISVHWNQ